jgi:hypothetical protein
MPTTSPGTTPGETVRDLGLPARAVTALTRAGITTTAQLAGLTRADLRAVNGLGPGSIAAIRRVVPEPPGRVPAGGRGERLSSPDTHPDDEESPAAPAIPSFESLRSTRRRTTVDLIVPATPPPPDTPPSAPPPPPDYADLWRLGVRVGQAVATLPVRLTVCAVREPVRRLRQLVGR